jgi:hypothetical protein
VNHSPSSSRASDEMYPRIRLGEGSVAIKDEECQRVVRIVAVLSQECSTQVALHGNELKCWLALMILQPTCPTAAEVAQPIKHNYSVFHFPNLPARTVVPGGIKSQSGPAGE